MYEVNSCPSCSKSDFTQFLSCKDFTVSSLPFSLKQCTTCGLVFTSPRPDDSELGKFYQSADYISHSETKSGKVNKLYHIVRKYTLKSKLDLINKLKSKSSLLDIGCGTGSFLSYCKKDGWEVNGMEPDINARSVSEKVLNQKIFSPEDLGNIAKNSYDIISLWHVLEHISDLNTNLNLIHGLLKSDGYLIIALPNKNSFDANYYQEFWAGFDVPRHLWHFTPDTVDRLLSKYGFTLVKVKGMWFDSYYVSILSEKYKNAVLGFFIGIFIGLISNIKALLSKSNTCSSQIYIFKKHN